MRRLVCVIVLFMASTATAQMNDYLYILKAVRPEMVTGGPNEREMPILGQHGAYLARLTREGTLYIAGRTQEADSMGLAIFRAPSDEAARAIMNADPAVKNGVMTATLHPYKAAFLTGRATADDRKAIDELHRLDEEASKKGDQATLRELLSPDMVALPPKEQPDMKNLKVLDYHLDFEEVNVLGDYAYEWGTITGTSQLPDGTTRKSVFNVMRILKRDTDGRWKVHRSIWNEKAGLRP